MNEKHIAETLPPPEDTSGPSWVNACFETMLSTEKQGSIYTRHETTTAKEVECLHDEFEGETRVGFVVAQTDLGGPCSKYNTRKKTTNESGYGVYIEENRLLVLAGDGAGGTGRGRVAFRALGASAAKGFRERLGPEELCERLHQDVRTYAKEDALDQERGYAAGAFLLIDRERFGKRVHLVAAGDVECLTIREGKKLPQGTTTPQTFPWVQGVRTGSLTLYDYFNHPSSGMLVNSFGGSRHIPTQLTSFEGQENDLVILADDGIRGVVSEYEMIRIAKEEAGDPKRIEKRLFALAYARQNSLSPFTVELSRKDDDVKSFCVNDTAGINLAQPDVQLPDEKKGGDNMVLVVVKLKNLG